jgi:hypothetical protein
LLLEANGLRYNGDGDLSSAQTERRGGAGPVRGLLGGKDLTGRFSLPQSRSLSVIDAGPIVSVRCSCYTPPSDRGAFSGACTMPAIRIPDAHWGKVWRALVASGPISRISQEHIYLVSERQVRMLRRKKLPFELIPPADGNRTGPKHG